YCDGHSQDLHSFPTRRSSDLNLFHGSEGSKNIVLRVLQKVKEWIIAVKLERQYTKSEILAHYLNTVDFVSNAYGIRSAANVYFRSEEHTSELQSRENLVCRLL